MNELEVWKQVNVEFYFDRYEVSNTGKVKSLVFYDKLNRLRGGNILKFYLDKRGYPRVALTKNYSSKHYRIHRLVALTFIPNPNELPQVNHKDGIKTNNNVSNLEWVTNKHNNQHGHKLGLYKYFHGIKHQNFIAPIQVFKDGKQIDTIYGNTDAKQKGYEIRNISACLFGKRKKHKECTFKRQINNYEK